MGDGGASGKRGKNMKLRRNLKLRKHKKQHYNFAFDNLAIPEIHTKKHKDNESNSEDKPSVTYDTVAIPEVHIHKRNKKKDN